MRDYFTIMLKENETTNLGLLTEKLKQGFYVDNQFQVGKSLLLVLTKRVESIELTSHNSAGLGMTEASSIPASIRF